ncbi:hypothetical protein GIY62_14745 [Burkholderia plantarii]|uniref:hypothetical protein n=1 Tax=Burkholderia plantarii TaxID=41899 RepID=UPI00272C4E15|nr:hypothetical protein [Burkholderia plantarii]WLE58385.1 hypothetical protein GIY62_14745 [Burkholderia plantarii]
MQTADNAAPEGTTATPASHTETAHQPAETSTAPGTEQTPATAPADPSQQKSDVLQRRIDKLVRERHEERRAREAVEARLRELQPPPASAPAGAAPTADQIRAEATRIVRQEKFDEACNRVFDAGKAEFGKDWDSSLQMLGAVGNLTDDFLDIVTSMDAGHKVLQHLGQNPDVAERVLSLPPTRMALELARLETTVGQAKTPPPVSQAPAPINPVGSKSAPVEPQEFASTEDYIAWRKRNKS